MLKGLVLDNVDPEERDRVKIHVPSKHDDGDGIWCEDAIGRNSQGDLPRVNTLVWTKISKSEPSMGWYFGYVKY